MKNLCTDEIKNENSILPDLKIPEAVFDAQLKKTEFEQEQTHSPKVHLFFSFDIVNSTMYKALTGNWPIIIRGLLEDVRTRIFRMSELEACFLWRVIGDEMIFVLPIQSQKSLPQTIDAIFEVTQRLSISLKSGKFFDGLENQSIQKNELNMLKTQSPLSVKSTAWVSVINDHIESPYDNISFNYSASSQNQIIKEYLGKDIDTGFRLKSYTQDRRLVISYELAYLLMKSEKDNNCMHIIDYVRLKGVWNEALYPIIWFYDAKIVESCNFEMTGKKQLLPFANSFRYDETDNNPLVKNFFSRGSITKQKNEKKQITTDDLQLASSMYIIDSALKKIALDRNLQAKIDYINSLFNDLVYKISSPPYAFPLEMHCAVVCCNIQERKIFITHRCSKHSTNPNKWEFGCAKATSEKSLTSSIEEYYRTTFGIEIELILDQNRNEHQPLPIAVYELNHDSTNIKKGIIFVAKVKNAPEDFRSESSHDCVEWISEEEIFKYTEDETIPDFHYTLKTVFNQFDKLFLKN